MKRLFLVLALAALSATAGAQVTFTGGTDITSIAGYNPDGGAGSLVDPAGEENATITTSAGLLTATFLGFEAVDNNTYGFSTGSGLLSNGGALGSTATGFTSAGPLNFTFADMTTGTAVGNGGNASSPYTSYAVLGSFANGSFTPYTMGGLYDIVLGFNDGARVDADYDDMVVGLRVTPVPEPETYALMLAGIGAVGFMRRRRKNLQ